MDALGIDKPEPTNGSAAPSSSATGAVGKVDDKALWDQLRPCYDPEIPVNIVDLVSVQDENPAAIGGRLKSVFVDGDRAIGTEMTGEELVVISRDVNYPRSFPRLAQIC